MLSYLQYFKARLDFQLNIDTFVGTLIGIMYILLGTTFLATLVGFIMLDSNLDHWLFILRCYTVFSVVLVALARINYHNRQ